MKHSYEGNFGRFPKSRTRQVGRTEVALAESDLCTAKVALQLVTLRLDDFIFGN